MGTARVTTRELFVSFDSSILLNGWSASTLIVCIPTSAVQSKDTIFDRPASRPNGIEGVSIGKPSMRKRTLNRPSASLVPTFSTVAVIVT